MTKSLTPTQQRFIELMAHGDYRLEHFRGIGTRYPAGTSVVDIAGARIMTIPISTFRAIRDKGLLQEERRDNTHTTYKLK